MTTLEQRPLGRTGMQVATLALGTVKIGRNSGVKYPETFDLPDDRQVLALLDTARGLGINLLDTAPAYGSAEQRLGDLLPGQPGFLVCTKVGESWGPDGSNFDFTPEGALASIARSRQRLRREVLDLVLVHADDNDLAIIEQHGTLDALASAKARGDLRAFGISSKTVACGLAAVPLCDVLMLEYSLQEQRQLPVLQAARAAGTGVLVKKALASGHLGQPADQAPGSQPAANRSDALAFAAAGPGVSSVVVGTLRPDHLAANVQALGRP